MTLASLMQNGSAKANELFSRLSETSDGAVKTREKLFGELKSELDLHVSLEEQHLFPVLRKNAETRDLVAEAIKDNKEMRAKLAEIETLPKNDDKFPERIAELQKTFRQHARDAQKEMLPAVRRALSNEQMQGVTEKMEAGVAEAEQARQDEAETRRAQAREAREEAEEKAETAAREERVRQAALRRSREAAQLAAEVAVQPAAVAAETSRRAVRLVADSAETVTAAVRSAPAAPPFGNPFLWPWAGMMGQSGAMARSATPTAYAAATRSSTGNGATRPAAGQEEVVPLGEEVLEIGKRTEFRGTARVRRFTVETPVEQQVSLASERVVIERRRPATDAVTGEILTDLTIEVVETDEVPVVGKRMRLREEIVVRTERSQRMETVRETVRRDEVEIQQSRQKPNGAARPQR